MPRRDHAWLYGVLRRHEHGSIELDRLVCQVYGVAPSDDTRSGAPARGRARGGICSKYRDLPPHRRCSRSMEAVRTLAPLGQGWSLLFNGETYTAVVPACDGLTIRRSAAMAMLVGFTAAWARRAWTEPEPESVDEVIFGILQDAAA